MLKNDARVGFSLAASTLRRGNKKTSFLTIFVLTLIFVNLVFLPAIINGMGGLFTQAAIDYVFGNVVIEPAEDDLFIEDSSAVLKRVRGLSEVTHATRRIKSGATLSHEDKFQGANLIGINPEDEIEISKFDDVIVEGEFLGGVDRNEIVLGRFVAGEEGVEVLDDLGGVEVGTIINATFSNGATRNYKIKGIFAGGTGISDTLALVNYKELEDVLNVTGQDRASEIVVRIQEQGTEARVKEKLIDLGVKEKVFTWQEKIEDLIRDIVRSFNVLSLVSTIVSIIIAVFVLFIIIYINTLNRKKQIGILKAIGITPGSVILSYILMSLFYTLGGIIAGGIFLTLIILYLTANPLDFAGLSLIPIVQFPVVVQNVVSLLITAVIAGLIPAWFVTKDPILDSIWGK